jgi:hypothetical protein
MTKSQKIYVHLQDEGVDVWRPVTATSIGKDVYQIDKDQSIPEDEDWEYKPGDKVRCKTHTFEGGEQGLIAFEKT